LTRRGLGLIELEVRPKNKSNVPVRQLTDKLNPIPPLLVTHQRSIITLTVNWAHVAWKLEMDSNGFEWVSPFNSTQSYS